MSTLINTRLMDCIAQIENQTAESTQLTIVYKRDRFTVITSMME